jgi:hypothetical protein
MSYIKPTETAVQKAREIIQILKGISVSDIKEAMEMVELRIVAFSDDQIFNNKITKE